MRWNTFAGRIHLCIFLVSTALVSAVSAVLYNYTSTFAHDSYVNFYNSVADNLMLELQQLEMKTDLRMDATALAMKERLRHRDLPTHEELRMWARELDLDLLYSIDADGRFIRSAIDDLHITPNAFSFCKDYKDIFEKRGKFTPTGVVLSVPNRLPFKFTFIVDEEHNGLIELGIHVDYIGKSLQHIQASDDQVESISLEAPNGEILAEYRRASPSRAPDIFQKIASTLAPTLDDSLVVTRVVPAVQKYCCSCVRRGLVPDGEDYRYILKLGITQESLRRTFGRITYLAATIWLIATLLGALIAKTLAARLVKGLNQIRDTVGTVIRTGNLDARLSMRQRDEIGDLAEGLNRMIAGLAERKKIELELERQSAIASTAQNIAHDLKNPIATIERATAATSWDQFARRKPEAMTALLRLQSMIEGFRHVDAERIILPEPSFIDIAAVAKEALAGTAARDIEVEARGDGIACQVTVDKPKLDRAISNLITNAIEAGASRVLIEAHLDGSDLAISVIDDGPGVPAEIEHDIFSRGTSFGKAHGLGIGLDYVATVARGHGGSIEYRRHEERTIFRITLKDVSFRPYPEQKFNTEREALPPSDQSSMAAIIVHLSDSERQTSLLLALAVDPTLRVLTDPTTDISSDSLVYTDDGELMSRCMASGVPVVMANSKECIEDVANRIRRRTHVMRSGRG